MDKSYLTKERYEELKKELEKLKKKGRLEVAERLKRAKEFGDLSENSEYAEAREQQAYVESRIFELEELLKKASLIKKSGGKEQITVGSTVTAQRGDREVRYTIVGSYEAKPEEGRISDESPIGRALLNKKVGDSAEVETPGGLVTYRVTSIE
ncbi:transcription elongation factor GreA [Candidatus Parcubacteria bacterium]|nr:MAG: transcription elongation factor GreA [Candidatus Parcubacteria bacterium]